MAKIKLIRYPYKDFEVGEIVDLGEEKNKSMVALQRAVWKEEEKPKKVVKTEDVEPKEETPKEESEKQETSQPEETQPKEKKFLQNELQAKVEEKKKSSPKKSFWDKLK